MNENMKMTVVTWFDPDTPDTALLAAEAYKIKVASQKPGNSPDETFIAVYGPEENVDLFLEDFESGDVRPMVSARDLDDDEWHAWLHDQLAPLGVLYVPPEAN